MSIDAQTVVGGVAVVVAGAGVVGIFRMAHQLTALVAKFDAHLSHNAAEHERFRETIRHGEVQLTRRLDDVLRRINAA